MLMRFRGGAEVWLISAVLIGWQTTPDVSWTSLAFWGALRCCKYGSVFKLRCVIPMTGALWTTEALWTSARQFSISTVISNKCGGSILMFGAQRGSMDAIERLVVWNVRNARAGHLELEARRRWPGTCVVPRESSQWTRTERSGRALLRKSTASVKLRAPLYGSERSSSCARASFASV